MMPILITDTKEYTDVKKKKTMLQVIKIQATNKAFGSLSAYNFLIKLNKRCV